MNVSPSIRFSDFCDKAEQCGRRFPPGSSVGLTEDGRLAVLSLPFQPMMMGFNFVRFQDQVKQDLQTLEARKVRLFHYLNPALSELKQQNYCLDDAHKEALLKQIKQVSEEHDDKTRYAELSRLIENYSVEPEKTRELLACLDEFLKTGNHGELVRQVLHCLANQDNFPVSHDLIDQRLELGDTPSEIPAARQLRKRKNVMKATDTGPIRTRHFKPVNTLVGKKQRMVDDARHPVRFDPAYKSENDRERWCHKKTNINHKKIIDLEYRVELSNTRVSEKIASANESAEEHRKIGEVRIAECRISRQYPVFKDAKPAAAESVPKLKSGIYPECRAAGYAESLGLRDIMEDFHTMESFKVTCGSEEIPVTLAGIFDGHPAKYSSGRESAEYVKNNIMTNIKRQLERLNKDGLTEAGIWNALKLASVETDRSKYFLSGGTTACVVLTINDRIWTANVGDSRALLVNREGACLQLSEDATPDGKKPNSFTRSVLKRDGDVNGSVAFGSNHGRYAGGIFMARTIGDHLMGGALSARGKITSHRITQDVLDSHIVIASDGLFNRATTAEVAASVTEQLDRKPKPNSTEIALELVQKASTCQASDNLSIVVAPVSAMVDPNPEPIQELGDS